MKSAHWGVLGIFFAFLFLPAVSAHPVPYLTERVNANYYLNGTPVGNVTGYGYVEVYVDNRQDVLQYIRINLSSTSDTNILSNQVYRNVAGSPNAGDRTRMYINTTEGESEIRYDINQSIIKVLKMRVDHRNADGGKDLHANGSNIIEFNITLSSDHSMSGVNFVFQAARNTLGSNDAMNIFSSYSPWGFHNVLDGDGDGFYDRIIWSLNINPGINYTLQFFGNITPDVNYDNDFMYTDPDNIDGFRGSCSSQGSTMTGISITDRFSRGPIRQGVEMINATTWKVRGFITNIAQGLSYIVNGWKLYRIGDPNPVSWDYMTQIISPGQTYTTDLFDTSSGDMGVYYSSNFEWELVWESPIEEQLSTSIIDFPYLYAIDVWPDKMAGIMTNVIGSVVLRQNDTAKHIGHGSIPAYNATIYSLVPHQSIGGNTNPWSIGSVRVYYINNSGRYDITSSATVTRVNPTQSQDGYLRADLHAIDSIIGRPLGQNEDIMITYDLSGSSSAQTHTYNFVTYTTLFSRTGTPVTRSAEYNLTVPASGEAPAPGEEPPSGAPSIPEIPPEEYFAGIIKEDSSVRFVTDDYVDINVTYSIIDSGTRGISDIKLAVYIPSDGYLEESELVLYVYDRGENEWLSYRKGVDFDLIRRGLTVIGKNEYIEYLIEKRAGVGIYEETLDLEEGDRIKIGYKTRVPYGTSYILTRAFGYNHYSNAIIFEDYYTPVRRDVLLDRLEIGEGEWRVKKSVAGNPVVWIKEYEIFNPNNVTVSQVMITDVFPDTLSGNLVEYNDSEVDRKGLELRKENSTYLNWIVQLCGLCRKTYEIEITTPPVLKVNENLDVLEINESTIIFDLNTTLRNFALEDYTDVIVPFPVNNTKIIYIGGGLNYSTHEGGLSVLIPEIASDEMFNVFFRYMERPPILVTSLNALEYRCAEEANVTLFVIPSENHMDSYIEFEVIGPYPYLKTPYADYIKIGKIDRLTEVRVPITLDVQKMPSGKYMTYAKFREGFYTLLSDKKEFKISCEENIFVSINWIIILAICMAIIGYLVFRIYRKKSYKKEISDLKGKLKEIE